MKRAFLELLAVISAITLFVGLASHQLHMPGLYYDEAADAVPAMQIVLNQPIELSRGAGIEWNGRVWPLMVMDYVGSVSTYLLVPSIQILGVTTEAVRAMPIAVGAMSIGLAFLALRPIVGSVAAAGAILLLAVHPSFVFWTRQGIHVSSILLFCSTLSLWMLARWYVGKGGWNLAIAGLVIGLGVSIKILFIWWPLALAAAAILLLPPWAKTQRRLPFLRWWDIPWTLIAGILFVVGAGFLILYNVQTQGTIKILTENATTTAYGVDNRAWLPNLLTRIDAFGSFLRGDHFWYLGAIYSVGIYPYALGIAIGLIVLLVIVDADLRTRWRRPAFLVLVIVFVILQSTVTVSGLGPTHFYLLFPLPQALIALVAVWLVEAVAKRVGKPVTALVGATAFTAILSVFGFSMYNDMRYHTTLAESGGWGNYSDSIIDLTDYLIEWKGHQPVMMDWGISKTVQYLSKGEVNPPELFGYTGPVDPTLEDRLQPYLEKPFVLYVFHDDALTNYPRYRAFVAAVQNYGKYVKRELLVEQRDGKPLFRAYTANDPD